MVRPRWMLLGSIALAAHVMASRSARAGYPACPTAGAPLDVIVDNQKGSPQTITFTGTRISQACAGGSLATTYSQSATCGVGQSTCITLTGLEPGVWNHAISVGSQQQATQNILIGNDPAGINNSVSWTAFKTVVTVDNTGDGTGNCSQAGQCTLRKAIETATNSPYPPALVQFSPTVFPAGTQTTVTLASSANLTIGGYRMMVDGTDLNGNPAFAGTPYDTAPTYSRVVQLNSTGSSFVFSNQLATLAGLFLQRPTQPAGPTPGVPKDVITFSGSNANQNTVVNCKIDGGGAVSIKSVGQDCIEGIDHAGGNLNTANVVKNTEMTLCLDKAVKSSLQAYVKVQDSWAHEDIGGGFQATESGNIQADHNIVERTGWNAAVVTPVGAGTPTPTPVFINGNGLSSNGKSSTPQAPNSQLNTHGNLTRRNALRGLSVDVPEANASFQGDFACANRNGVAIVGGATNVTVRGGAFVYNWTDGAVVNAGSSGDFGTDQYADPGNNSFAWNTSYDFQNNNSGSTMQAVWNQWQGCPTSSSCSPRKSGSVNYTPWQPYEGSDSEVPLTITEIYPQKTRAFGVVHITGTGFNAVDSYSSTGSCPAGRAYTSFNKCDSSGNPSGPGICVTVSVPNTSLTAKPLVLSVTPTDIAFWGIAEHCFQPATVTVKRYNPIDPSKPFQASGTICANE